MDYKTTMDSLQYFTLFQYTASFDFILQFVQTNSTESFILNSPFHMLKSKFELLPIARWQQFIG